MKLTLLYTCILMFFTTSLFPMKRARDESTNEQVVHTKQQTRSLKLQSLSNFFATHTKLQDICKQLEIDKEIVDYIPQEIQYHIMAQKLYDPKIQEWWYNSKILINQPEHAYSIAFNPENQLAIGLSNNLIKIIDPHTDKLISSIETTDGVSSISYSPDGTLLGYGLLNGNTHILSTKNYMPVCPTIGIARPVWTMSIGNNNTCAILGWDHLNNNHVTTVDIATGNHVMARLHPGNAYSLSLHPTKDVITYAYRQWIKAVSLAQPEFPAALHTTTNQSATYALAYHYAEESLDEKLAIGYGNNKITIINPLKGKMLSELSVTNKPYSTAFNTRGDQLAVSLGTGSVLLFKQHTTFSSQQILLRSLMHLWIQTKKQPHAISSPLYMLHVIANSFNLMPEEIITIWNTFPQDMQDALWRKMKALIITYGHPIRSMYRFLRTKGLVTLGSPLNAYKQQLYFLITEWTITRPLKNMVTDRPSLISTLAVIHNLDETELTSIWTNLSENQQSSLWQLVQSRIEH